MTITQVQNPDTVTFDSSDIIHVKATVAAGGFSYCSPNTGLYGVLVVALMDGDNGYSTIYGADVVATSEPDVCHQVQQNGTIGPPATDCRFKVEHPSATETVDFAFADSHAPPLSVWHLEVWALAVAGISDTSIVTSSASYNFTMSVVGIQSVQTTSSQTHSYSYTSAGAALVVRTHTLTALCIPHTRLTVLTQAWRIQVTLRE